MRRGGSPDRLVGEVNNSGIPRPDEHLAPLTYVPASSHIARQSLKGVLLAPLSAIRTSVNKIREAIEASIAIKQAMLRDTMGVAALSEVSEATIASLRAGGKVLFCGNGGSAADAQHLAAELTGRSLVRGGLNRLL